MRLLPSGAVSLACRVRGTGSQGGVSLPRSFGSFSFLRTEAKRLFPMPFEAWLASLPPPVFLASGTSWVCMSVHTPSGAAGTEPGSALGLRPPTVALPWAPPGTLVSRALWP